MIKEEIEEVESSNLICPVEPSFMKLKKMENQHSSLIAVLIIDYFNLMIFIVYMRIKEEKQEKYLENLKLKSFVF